MSSFATNPLADDEDGPPLRTRHQPHVDAEFDITAMIDLVFMMNIFFMVTSITAAMADIELPAARHVVAADRETASIITIMADKDRRGAKVFLGDDPKGEPLSDPNVMQTEIKQAVQEATRNGMKTVIIRAERDVPIKEVANVSRAAAQVPGIEIKYSVVEKE